MLGQWLKISTKHKNITCKYFNNEHLLRWRIMLEEYGPGLIKAYQQTLYRDYPRRESNQLHMSPHILYRLC